MKKLFAIIMTLMVLALPMAGMAEGDFISEAVANGRMVERTTTFSMMETGDETADQIIGGLLDSLAVVTYSQEAGKQSGLAVNMNGKDILTIDVAVTDEKLYLRSDLLKGDTVVFAEGDSQAITENLLKTLVAEGIIGEDDMATALAQMETALSDMSNPMADVDFEAVINGFDFTELVQFGTEFIERVEEGDLSGLPEGSDPAIRALTLRMTGEDIVRVYDVIFNMLKANKEYLAMLDSMIVSVDDVNMSAEEALNQMQQQIDTQMAGMVEGDIPTTIYLNGDDEVVAVTSDFVMKVAADEGSEPEPISAKIVYFRQTADAQVQHSFNYTIENNDGVMARVSGAVVAAGGTTNARVSIQDDENTITFTFQKTENASDTERSVNAVVSVSYGANDAVETSTLLLTVDIAAAKNDVDAEQITALTLSMDGTELGTMITHSKTADPKESIVSEDAIRLAEMPQEDFQSWFEGVIFNLQVWLMTAVQALPTSVLMLMAQ